MPPKLAIRLNAPLYGVSAVWAGVMVAFGGQFVPQPNAPARKS
jgi:hypothetical protein